MNSEFFNQTIDWFADHGILILSLLSLHITILIKSEIINRKVRFLYISVIVGLTILFSMNYFLVQLAYFTYTFMPLICISICYFFKKSGNLKRNKIIAVYLFVILQSLIAFILAKVSFNTWGSGTIFAGVFMLVYIILLFQVLRFYLKEDKIHGYSKLFLGLVLLVFIFTKGYSHSDYDGESLDLIRKSMFIMSVVFVLEGAIVLVPLKAKSVLQL